MKLKFLLFCSICLLILRANGQDKSISVTPENIIITPENPLAVKDTALRESVANWCIKQLKESDYKKIKAHPSSDFFPGKVKDGYEFTGRTIKISHQKISSSLIPVVSKLDYSSPWANTMYSTGMYAVPG